MLVDGLFFRRAPADAYPSRASRPPPDAYDRVRARPPSNDTDMSATGAIAIALMALAAYSTADPKQQEHPETTPNTCAAP